jgi:hypothetical protein
VSSNALQNTIVLLIGFAGTGKYTIGRELCRRTGAKLIDNHLIANPVFKVVNADGVTPLPSGVWDKIKQIRRTVYEAMRELSPPEMSFVLTVEWRRNNAADLTSFADLEQLAVTRQSLFVPIRLICEVDELCRRVVQPARVEMLKEISPELARKKSADDAVLNPDHPNLRTIDVTRMSPDESVEAILNEVNSIRVLGARTSRRH